MDIRRLLNPNPPESKGDRVGRRRVEKACPRCAVKNHIRTNYCKGCNNRMHGQARGGRRRANASASAGLAEAAAGLALPPAGGRMKDRRRATQRIPPVTCRVRSSLTSVFVRGREEEEGDPFAARDAFGEAADRQNEPLAAYVAVAELPVVVGELERLKQKFSLMKFARRGTKVTTREEGVRGAGGGERIWGR